MVDFKLVSNEQYSAAFREEGIHSFRSACEFVAKLPYGRNANRSDISLVLKEKKGTCSSKHALLAFLADENQHKDVELMVGIFLMGPETHPAMSSFFIDKSYKYIPEAHCYLRWKGERFDYTNETNQMERIAPFIVREQRIEPNQVIDWKVKIHQDYIQKWLQRNPQIDLGWEELWQDREAFISLLETDSLSRQK